MTRRTLLRIAKKMPRCRPGLPHLPHALPVEMAHVAQWFHAASDVTRLAILELLAQRDRCVTELREILGAPQSSVSFHLKVLRESGLVRAYRERQWKYYGLRGETLDHMIAFTHIVSPTKHRGTCALSCCQ
jgi:ArsR family transcriptional regulator, arsenate/arsenite/antimonite-responsive transcriptional repressor